MSAAHQKGSSAAGFLARLVRAWNGFWFKPGDPTTLGLIRLFCGFTVFYIHLAYSYDLQEFFGKDAWISAETVDDYRHNSPDLAPISRWDDLVLLKAENREEQEYINKWGINPRQAYSFVQYRWSIWYHVND